MTISCHLTQADLQDYVKRVLGTGYVVSHAAKMQGGAQKAVYKLECGNGFSCILYVWDLKMNYFREEIEKEAIHSRSYGGDLFELNNRYLTQHGIRTPALYDLNRVRDRYPFDYALVEFADGRKADDYVQKSDLQDRDKVFHRIGEMLANMHANVRETYGKVNSVCSPSFKCHHLQLKNAEENIDYAGRYLASIKDAQDKLLDTLYDFESKIRPRQRYGFIHGELGPDHIIVNDKLEPCLIDIEGAEFFDIEHEHSFLELRFGNDYHFLKCGGLDPNRMLFYRFCHHISITAGFLKLLQRGFPAKKFAREVIEHHVRRALQSI